MNLFSSVNRALSGLSRAILILICSKQAIEEIECEIETKFCSFASGKVSFNADWSVFKFIFFKRISQGGEAEAKVLGGFQFDLEQVGFRGTYMPTGEK